MIWTIIFFCAKKNDQYTNSQARDLHYNYYKDYYTTKT